MNPSQMRDRFKGYGAADIHIHSTISDGMASVEDILQHVVERGDIDVIAITDHDEIRGSYQARELAAKRGYPIDVVVGMEINSAGGHLLAVFIESPVAGGMSVPDTISAIHSQGGLCILPHPMSIFSESLSMRDIENVMSSNDDSVYFDGIETVNATIVGSISNRRAKRVNIKYGLSEIGSSDAHFLISVGTGLTLFPGKTANDLRRCILEGCTHALNGSRASYFDIGLMQIIKQQRKSGGYFVRGMFKNLARCLKR